MPLVTVRYKNEDLAEEVRRISLVLPHLVAFHLVSDDLPLMPSEIDFKAEVIGPMDKQTRDLCIIIDANDYPQRQAERNTRQEALRLAIATLLKKDITFYVWLRLFVASYGEAVGEQE